VSDSTCKLPHQVLVLPQQLYLQSLPVLADVQIMLYVCNEGLAYDDVVRTGVVVQLLVPLLHHPPLQISYFLHYHYIVNMFAYLKRGLNSLSLQAIITMLAMPCL